MRPRQDRSININNDNINTNNVINVRHHNNRVRNNINNAQELRNNNIRLNRQNIDAFNQVVDNSLAAGSKEGYKSKFKQLVNYVKENFNEYYDEENDSIFYDTISDECISVFFEDATKKKDKETGAYLVPEQHQSFTHVSGYNSAIKWMYKKNRKTLTPTIIASIKDFLDGYQRKVAHLKHTGEMELQEGRQPLSFTGYMFLCNKALTSGNDLGIFSWTFICLAWNLIARCISIAGLMYDHIHWVNDSMVYKFPMHKGDQEGKTAIPKHVYANPKNPAICPVLSFAVHLFSNIGGYRDERYKRTVFGQDVKNVEKKFSSWLSATCTSSEQDLLSMGLLICNIGTHSFRKGIADTLNSMLDGPSPIAIFIRAGWSLGKVVHRYLFEGGGNDQLCGRAATGLTITSPEFADLPPHFDISSGPVLTVSEWDDILPGYSTFYPENFRGCLPFLLASLVYHREWIINTFSSNHPLFSQRVWTSGIMQRLSEKVLSGNGRNEVSKLFATGIPAHILLSNELVKVKCELSLLKESISKRFDILPDQIKQTLLQHFQINGAIPITRDDISNMLETFQETIMRSFNNSILTNNSNNNTNTNRSNYNNITPFANSYNTWTYGGKIHPVPPSFKYPS